MQYKAKIKYSHWQCKEFFQKKNGLTNGLLQRFDILIAMPDCIRHGIYNPRVHMKQSRLMPAERKTSLNFCIHANYIIFAQEIITKTNKTT